MILPGKDNEAVARRVLVVEDDPVTQLVFNRLVSLHGCTVHAVSTAKEAYEHLATYTYALVILDAHLPDSHGADIARQIRLDPRTAKTPIVAVSSDDGSPNVRLLKEMGVDEFIPKPVAAKEIWEIVDRWLPLY